MAKKKIHSPEKDVLSQEELPKKRPVVEPITEENVEPTPAEEKETVPESVDVKNITAAPVAPTATEEQTTETVRTEQDPTGEVQTTEEQQAGEQTPTVAPPATPSEDAIRENLVESYRQQQNTFADILNSYRADYDREQQESLNAQRANVRAARWAGATELAASLANMFAVGEGGAVSQVYQPVSQNWMQKAEEESRYRRNRMENIRDRQRALQSQIAQLRSQEALQLARYDQDKQSRDAELAYNQTRIDYQNAQAEYYRARTDAQKQEADQKMKEAEQRLKYIEAQTKAQEALANSRNSSAYSSKTRADAAASNVENQNKNRDSRTMSLNAYDRARSAAAMRKAAGLNQTITIPQIVPGGQVVEDEDNTAPYLRNKK